jgi:NAD(P)-dependent dehydrogenase (short-subunit alcohol dehydrogenase family)
MCSGCPPRRGFGAYVRCAVRRRSRGIREWVARAHRVRCNAVAPPIDTPFFNTAVEESGALGARLRQGMIDATALARDGPESVASAIAFLASDDA